VEVVTVTPGEAEKMLNGTQDWQEFICLSVLV
jgi:hypothetical protein